MCQNMSGCNFSAKSVRLKAILTLLRLFENCGVRLQSTARLSGTEGDNKRLESWVPSNCCFLSYIIQLSTNPTSWALGSIATYVELPWAKRKLGMKNATFLKLRSLRSAFLPSFTNESLSALQLCAHQAWTSVQMSVIATCCNITLTFAIMISCTVFVCVRVILTYIIYHIWSDICHGTSEVFEDSIWSKWKSSVANSRGLKWRWHLQEV